MAKNIYKCAKRKFGALHCAFMKICRNEQTGELEENGCILGMKDEYRMLPEHHSNGDIIHNRLYNNDLVPYGIDVVWENDTPHDTGLTYSRDNHRLRSEEYNMHPLYSIQDINEPFITDVMADDHVGYAFGGDNIALSTGGWSTQKVLGLQRVEECNLSIYSKYDPIEKIVLPKCIRDYTGDIKDWINYTSAPTSKKKKSFFICNESDKNISEYCIKRLGKNLIAASIYQIMIAIKAGEYINLREALINHNLPVGTVNLIMNEVSTKGKSTIYSNMNLQKYWLYWSALSKMNLSKDKLWLFRCNLLNYVLNYPEIAKLSPNTIQTSTKGLYATNKRYWWIVLMVRNAFDIAKYTNRKIITNIDLKWIQPFVKEFVDSATKELDTNDLKNPSLKRFNDIIDDNEMSDAKKRRARVFARILKAGKRWSTPEVQLTWFYFLKAYDAKCPEDFWTYVETVRTSTPNGISNLIHIADLPDETELSVQRAFSHHLLEAKESCETFVVKEPKLHERWQIITPKSGLGSHDDTPKIEKNEIFWNQLKRIRILDRKKEKIFKSLDIHLAQLPIDQIKTLVNMYKDELDEDILLGTELSKDDIGREGEITIIDIDGNEDQGGGGDIWRDLESQE